MTELAKQYHDVILWLGAVTGQSDTVLHIHAGMAIFVLTRLVTGRSFGTFIPFAFVLAAELANEALDRLALGEWLPADVTMDLLNTLFWPFAISLGVRWRPMILRDRRSLDGGESAEPIAPGTFRAQEPSRTEHLDGPSLDPR